MKNIATTDSPGQSLHKPTLEEAFRYCTDLARRHYENFPVASLFLPKHLRPSVAAIYAFARTADDFADEGDLSEVERLAALDDWRQELDACFEGSSHHPVFVALAEVVRRKRIPKQLLADLLTAFTMDVTTKRYETYEELLNYCTHSANPVGRLILYLFDDVSERKFFLSDHICTALQLTNFWQDIVPDLKKQRIYIPLEDMRRFGYTENNLSQQVYDDRWQGLMEYVVSRTEALFKEGAPLVDEAVAQLRFELRLTMHGGMAILKKIRQSQFDVFTRRPSIGAADKLMMLVRAFFVRNIYQI